MDLHLKEDSLKGGRGGGKEGMQFGFERQFLKVILEPENITSCMPGSYTLKLEFNLFRFDFGSESGNIEQYLDVFELNPIK